MNSIFTEKEKLRFFSCHLGWPHKKHNSIQSVDCTIVRVKYTAALDVFVR